MAETIRTFIAIELNDQVKQTIQELQASLKPLGGDISWVRPENVHLTLKFLGDLKPKVIPLLTETLTNACQGMRPMATTLTQLGVFPDWRRPRVIWIGLHDEKKEIAHLAMALETVLGNIGYKKEGRNFQAHITFGRVRTAKNIIPLCETIKGLCVSANIKQSINKITLFQSTLTSQGPIYNRLKEFHFQTA